MFLTLDHRLAFVHVPKTAGEKIYKILYDAFRSGLVPNPTTTRTRTARHSTPPVWHDSAFAAFWGQDNVTGLDATHLHQDVLYDYVGRVLYESCLSFAVVRDPYDRFYSAFCDIPSKIRYSRDVVHNANPFWVGAGYPEYGDPLAPGTTPEQKAAMFERFCDIVEKYDIVNDTVTKHNIHLVPQCRFVYRSTESNTGKAQSKARRAQPRLEASPNVTTIVRFETLHTELPAVFRALVERNTGRVPQFAPRARSRSTSKRKPAQRADHPRSPQRGGGSRHKHKHTHTSTHKHKHTHKHRGHGHPRPGRETAAEQATRKQTFRPVTQTPCERALAAVQREFTAESVGQRSSKRSLYSERAKRLVAKLYKADFERFGYDARIE